MFATQYGIWIVDYQVFGWLTEGKTSRLPFMVIALVRTLFAEL